MGDKDQIQSDDALMWCCLIS